MQPATRVTVVRPGELREGEWARWAELQRDDPALASPFFAPAFTRAVGAVRRDAYVAVLEDGNGISAFLPFQRSATGVGRPVGGPLSDCHGIVGPAGRDWDARALLRACRLGAFDFHHLPQTQATFAPYVGAVRPTYLVNLSAGFEAYASGRRAAGSDVVAKVRASRRKLAAQAGAVRFVADDRSPAAFESLVAWKSAQYVRTGVPDLFARPWIAALCRHLAHTREPGFGGIVSTLYVDDRPIAAHFGIRSQRVWHYWFPTYDETFARFSPGTSLLLHLCEAAAELGCESVDLGPDDATHYKCRFACSEQPLGAGSVEVMPSTAALLRSGRRATVRLFRRLPLGPVSTWPDRAFRRIDGMRKFR